MPLIRLLGPDEWREYRKLRLRALADSPDSFSSTLAVEEQQSDAQWAERLLSGLTSGRDLPLVAAEGDELTGLVCGRSDPSAPETAYVTRCGLRQRVEVVVGLGLVEEVIRWRRKILEPSDSF
jgi:hypothetical protein